MNNKESTKKNNYLTASLSSIGKQLDARLDYKYREFWDSNKGEVFPGSSQASLRIKDATRPRPKIKYGKGTYEEDFTVIDLEYVEPRTGLVSEIEPINSFGSDRISLEGWDLFTNRLRPYLGKTFVNPGGQNLLGSPEWIPIKLDESIIHPKILQTLLLSEEYISSSRKLMSGKNHPRISEFDLFNLRIPYISPSKQDELVRKIDKYEKEIICYLKAMPEPYEVINSVFGKVTGINLSAFLEGFGKGMTVGTQKLMPRSLNMYEASVNKLTNSFSLRTSVRYHRPEIEKLTEIMKNLDTVALKHCIREPIRRGVQPKTVENGDIIALKTAQLKNGTIIVDESQKVKRERFEKIKEKAGVTKGDVLLASTGKGSLGKVDVYELDEEAMVDGHISIIRLHKGFNPLFIAYYIRSLFGTFQIERDFSGATNQIELNPEQIAEFKILKFDLKTQQDIVEAIRDKLNERDRMNKKIQRRRDIIQCLVKREMY